MASSVISATITAKNNARANKLFLHILGNPFKRERHAMDDESSKMVVDSPHWQSESSEGRKTGDTMVFIPTYGSVGLPRVGRTRSSHANPPYLQTSSSDADRFGGAVGEGDVGRSSQEEDIYQVEDDFTLTTTSYRRLIRLFSLVPITALLAIYFFICLRYFLWPAQTEPSLFTSHIGLAILGAAAWTVSFALRIPVFLISSLVSHAFPSLIPFISASLQVFVEELLRFSSLVLTHIHISSGLGPEDPAFSHVWTLALGWAAAEVAVSVSQGYEQLLLYSDVLSLEDSMSSPHRDISTPSGMDEQSTVLNTDNTSGHCFHDPEEVMNEEIDRVLRIRARNELETLYGIPVTEIPVFVSCLLRIDSITLSVALFLIISSTYLPYLAQSSSTQHPLLKAACATLPIFLVVVMLRAVLSWTWTLNILPRIGLHAASYMSCVFALGAFFVGLGRWDAV